MNKNESKYFSTAEKMDSALMEILKTKSFEYITVSEICKKAGVNRSTFYLHYENTRDLLEETIRNMTDNFVSYFVPDGKISPINFEESQKENLVFISEEYLMPYLSYFKENRKIFAERFGSLKIMRTFAAPFEKRVLERGFEKFIEKTVLLYKKQVPRKTIYREALILLEEL